MDQNINAVLNLTDDAISRMTVAKPIRRRRSQQCDEESNKEEEQTRFQNTQQSLDDNNDLIATDMRSIQSR